MRKGLDWVRASVPHSTEPSSNYPERPIRPLPKRRIRSRLSLEDVDSIIFPPVAPSSSPLFGSPNNHTERGFNYGNVDGLPDEHDLDHVCDCGGHHSGVESDEEEEVQDRSVHRNSWPGRGMRYSREYGNSLPVRTKPPPPPHSTTSSADGYESFENTNNKKKRKIPISGTSGVGVGSDGVGAVTQSVDVSVSQDGQLSNHYYHSSGAGVGISGAGRGRNSKTVNRPLAERRPLASTTNGSNAVPAASSANHQGIISAAIASAESKQGSSSVGQENISLLQRQQHPASVPKDFTFEWPSDSGSKMGMSARGPMSPPAQSFAHLNANRPMATQGTQTAAHGSRPPNGQTVPQTSANTYSPNQQPMPPPKPRRRRRDSLQEAAQNRRYRQQQENVSNPPKPGDEYVCDFCTYELIYGHPPMALIRQYELRDRQARKREEAKKRNLEKLKAKGRKNRKGAKAGPKNPNPATGADAPVPQNQPYDPRYDAGGGDVDSQGDEYFDDGYDDPVPLPSQHHQSHGSAQNYHPPPPPPPPDDRSKSI